MIAQEKKSTRHKRLYVEPDSHDIMLINQWKHFD